MNFGFWDGSLAWRKATVKNTEFALKQHFWQAWITLYCLQNKACLR